MTNEELELKRLELELQRRQTTYRFIEIIFGTIILGFIAIVFQWESLRRTGMHEDRDFLIKHLEGAYEDKNLHNRKAKIERLIAVREKGTAILGEELQQAKLDIKVAEEATAAEEERIRAEKEAQIAKEEEKRAAETKLAAAKTKEAAAKKAQNERLLRALRKSTDLPGIFR